MNRASLGKRYLGTFLFYLHFYMDMVTIVSDISLQLQRDDLLVY